MSNVRNKTGKINIPDYCILNEPMSSHTSFRIGGPADIFCTPRRVNDVAESINLARQYKLSCQVIGGGANILVADRGIRGMVISLKELKGFSFSEDHICTADAGAAVSDLAVAAAERELSGIEFLYGLPGTLGGAVYMNARCYGTSTGDVLEWVSYLSGDLKQKTLGAQECGFDYKKSIFQHNGGTILQAALRLRPGDGEKISKRMEEHKRDREGKGHFTHPSAGSAFKNNRTFGKPTGQIIDSLGLKGFSVGGARVSPLHGNIVINSGDASAKDVKQLLSLIKQRVFDAYGLELEEEVIYLGEWD